MTLVFFSETRLTYSECLIFRLNRLLLRNKPLLVSQAMAFTSPAGLTTFPVCPACMATLEREGQNFCDHCGQRLDWRWYKHAQIIYPGQKSALNILDKDDVLIST